jgi:hypothetical protein
MTNPYQLPTVPYYDASQQPSTYYEASQEASVEQGEYSPMPAAYHPGPSTAESNRPGRTIYAPVPPSYTEQAEHPTPTEPTQFSPAEKIEAEQESKGNPKPSTGDAIKGIISLAMMAAILYGLGVGACKSVNHIQKGTNHVKAPSLTTAAQQYQPPSGVRLVTLVGPSTTVVSWVDFGLDGTIVEVRGDE